MMVEEMALGMMVIIGRVAERGLFASSSAEEDNPPPDPLNETITIPASQQDISLGAELKIEEPDSVEEEVHIIFNDDLPDEYKVGSDYLDTFDLNSSSTLKAVHGVVDSGNLNNIMSLKDYEITNDETCPYWNTTSKGRIFHKSAFEYSTNRSVSEPHQAEYDEKIQQFIVQQEIMRQYAKCLYSVDDVSLQNVNYNNWGAISVDNKFHVGIDVCRYPGAPIYAISDGIVSNHYDGCVVIHNLTQRVKLFYLHLNKDNAWNEPLYLDGIPLRDTEGNAIVFEDGSPILKGCQIGIEAGRYYNSTQRGFGEHTHLEINTTAISGPTGNLSNASGTMPTLNPYLYLDLLCSNLPTASVNADRAYWSLEEDDEGNPQWIYDPLRAGNAKAARRSTSQAGKAE